MEPEFRAAEGADAWQVSNPPILAAAPLMASLMIFAAAGMERLRAKSVALTDFMDELLKPLAPQVAVITPRQSAMRGCQLSLRIAGGAGPGRRVFERLRAHGVVCDWRYPDIIRVAPVPLYNTFEEVARFAERLRQVLGERA
jgi:kynureninase